jgi:hypothetical protein
MMIHGYDKGAFISMKIKITIKCQDLQSIKLQEKPFIY